MSTKVECIVIDTLNGLQDSTLAQETSKPDYDKWRNYSLDLYNFVKTLQKRGFELFWVLGDFGTGKSFGMKSLPEGSCIWFNADQKNPTWKGGKKIYGTKTAPTKLQKITTSYSDVFNYLNKIGKDNFVETPVAFLLGHTEVYKDGFDSKQRLKILGSMGNKMSVEGLSENTVYSNIEIKEGKPFYHFVTESNGLTTCRTQEGLFEDAKIPNDFNLILEKLKEY